LKNFTTYLVETRTPKKDLEELLEILIDSIKETINKFHKDNPVNGPAKAGKGISLVKTNATAKREDDKGRTGGKLGINRTDVYMAASTDYFIESEENTTKTDENKEKNYLKSSYRMIIVQKNMIIKELDYSGIREPALALVEETIINYNKRIENTKFSNCVFDFPKSRKFAETNPKEISDSFSMMVEEIFVVYQEIYLLSGNLGEAQTEATLTKMGYFKVMLTKEQKSRVRSRDMFIQLGTEILNPNHFIAQERNHRYSPDFLICIGNSTEFDKFKEVFTDAVNLETHSNKTFVLLDDKVVVNKKKEIRATQLANEKIRNLIKEVDEKNGIILSRSQIEFISKSTDMITTFKLTSAHGARIGSLNKDLLIEPLRIVKSGEKTYVMKNKNNLTVIKFNERIEKDENVRKFPTKDPVVDKKVKIPVKKQIAKVPLSPIEKYEAEKKAKKEEFIKNSLASSDLVKSPEFDNLRKSIKKTWLLFKAKEMKNVNIKANDVLKAKFIYYLVHPEEEIPTFIAGTQEILAGMNSIRTKLSTRNKKTVLKGDPKILFTLIEYILRDKKDMILLEAWYELCSL